DKIGYMRNRRVLLDGIPVFQFPDEITNPEQTTGGKLPARGQIVKITGATGYVALCEFQVDGCRENMWGGQCNMSCPSRCTVQCDRDTGDCEECRDNFAPPDCQGCKAGWHGELCNERCSDNCLPDNNGTITCEQDDATCTKECDSGYYLADSCKECGYCRDNDTCDNHNGHCPQGCRDGYGGDRCDIALEDPPDPDEDNTIYYVIGGVAAAVVLIAVVGAVLFLRRRRRIAKDRSATDRSNLQRSDSAPSIQGTGGDEKTKADKPLAHVKPLNRASPEADEPQGDTGHIYSNASALANPGTSETSSNTPAGISSAHNTQPEPTVVRTAAAAANPEGNNRPATTTSKPGPAPKRAPTARARPVYENFTLPNADSAAAIGDDVVPTTEEAPEPVARTSGGGRLKKSQTDEDFSEAAEDDVYNSEDLYASYKSLSSTQQLDPFQRYLVTRLGSGELEEEFDKLPKGMKQPHKIGLTEANKRKNRFKALCTYDFNRVILHKPEGDNSSDYINATYIKGCQRDKQYIATQGPRVNTIDDLWWMDKCEEYWPASGKSQTYGHVTVRSLEEQHRADYVIRSFVLNALGSERHVTQYHYMAWPDHGVPLAASLVDYWRYVKARATSTVPLLVHCSAGVGRTGTFIALDIASEKESRGDDVNVNEIVTQLREQRALMVQSEAQYKFLHEVILEAHTSRATRVTVAQFDSIFPDSIDENKDNARIDKEFQMLKLLGQFSAKPSNSMATMPENLDKNRNTDVLPDDDHLAYLSAYVRGRTQYINAVYLPSFHHRHGFVLTQLPIPNNTLIDFWRLVDGCHVTTIVSLGSDHEKETVKDFCQYWLHETGEVLTTGPYSITTKSTSIMVFVLSQNDESSREVEVLHYKNWADEVPSDTSSLLHLVDTVKAIQTDNASTPIIIQCIDGAAKSGLFAVLCDVISRVTHDDEVDIYLTAREVQRIRPQAVATQTQYRYLYKAAQEYIRHVGVYANSGVR
ncbi:hypothetical protein BaRGS_00022249, partial [Batillaria attramentaria]